DCVLVVVRSLVAIGVTNEGLIPIAAGPAGLLDDAIAGCDDGRADGRGPVSAGVHLDIAQHRVAPGAEAGCKPAVRDWVSQQELLGAASFLVEIVNRAVLQLEAVQCAGY